MISAMTGNPPYVLRFGILYLLLNLNVNNSFLIRVIFKHNIKWKLESYHFRNSTVRVNTPTVIKLNHNLFNFNRSNCII